MFDLKLNKRGDLILEQSDCDSSKIKIDFYCAQSNAIKINFFLEDFLPTNLNGICINFDVNKDSELYLFNTVNNMHGIYQACDIRLRTEKGDMLNNKDIGSYLESVRHMNIHDQLVQNEIQNLVKNAVSDILPQANIAIEPSVIQSSTMYSQGVKVSIYDEDTVVANYRITR